jgi:DNA-binding transcriptional regulator YdaS (Cro superfamily)
MCKKRGKMNMTLEEYFATEPRGSKVEMADYLGISATYISLLIHKKRRTSKSLAISIENATQGLVKRQDLRPDLFVV